MKDSTGIIEARHQVTLSDSEVLFLGALLTEKVLTPFYPIDDSHYAARLWHKIVPDYLKGE